MTDIASFPWLLGYLVTGYSLHNRCRPQGHKQFVVADDVVAMTAFVGGTTDHIFSGAIMADHIKRDRRKIVNGVPEVAGDRKRLKEDFRHNYCRANIQNYASFKLRNDGGKLLEVNVARFAEHATIRRRVLMDDVRADGDVDGRGNFT